MSLKETLPLPALQMVRFESFVKCAVRVVFLVATNINIASVLTGSVDSPKYQPVNAYPSSGVATTSISLPIRTISVVSRYFEILTLPPLVAVTVILHLFESSKLSSSHETKIDVKATKKAKRSE